MKFISIILLLCISTNAIAAPKPPCSDARWIEGHWLCPRPFKPAPVKCP